MRDPLIIPADWPMYPVEVEPAPGVWEHRMFDRDGRCAKPKGVGGIYFPVDELRARTRAADAANSTPPFAPAPAEKPSNPKDAAAVDRPWPILPLVALLDGGLKLAEGLLKYGAHNYTIVGVRSSVYVAAAARHLFKWWCGEEYEMIPLEDEDGKPTGEVVQGVHHLGGVIASVAILRDAQWREKLTDDRPPRLPNLDKLFDSATATLRDLIRAHGHKRPRHYTIADSE